MRAPLWKKYSRPSWSVMNPKPRSGTSWEMLPRIKQPPAIRAAVGVPDGRLAEHGLHSKQVDDVSGEVADGVLVMRVASRGRCSSLRATSHIGPRDLDLHTSKAHCIELRTA